MNSIIILLEKLNNTSDFTPKEIRTLKVALKIWNAIDDVLDDELGLNIKDGE